MGKSKGSFLDPKTLKCDMKYLAFLKEDSTMGCISCTYPKVRKLYLQYKN